MASDGLCRSCLRPVSVAVMTPPPEAASAPTALSPAAGATGSTAPLTAWPGAFTEGQPFGARYRIIRLLGAGGMGAVYQAWDSALDEPVALKIIRPEITADPDAARELERRFKRELQLARQVSHPNVVRIHDLGEIEGTTYLSMAFVQGADLHSILKREGRLPVPRALAIARQVAAGLSAAHDAGVVHRDLKPANIMVDEQGRASIMDFGIARSVAAEGVTQAGVVVGTLEYMSPEQAQGHAADARADIYAFGLILRDLLVGRRSEAVRNPTTELMQRMKEAPAAIRRIDPAIPEPVEHLLAGCLAPHPDERFRTTRDLVRALDALDDEGRVRQGVSEVRPAISRLNALRPTRWSDRRRRVAAGLTLIVAVTAAAAGAAWLARRGAQDAATGSRLGAIPSPEDARRVAVLPFRSLGNDSEIGHLALGLTESLAARLFPLKDLYVAAAPDVTRATAEHAQDTERVARDLGVNLLVQGSVRGDADRIRVTVTLDDMHAGTRVWAEEFSGVAADLFSMEDRVFEAVVAKLGITPTGGELARGAVRPTLNAAAYDLYLRGRETLRSSTTPERIQAAIALFEQSLERDPSLALARSGIADAALHMYRETRDRAWADRALQSAESAVRVDATLPEVHFALGSVYEQVGRQAEAIQVLRKALEMAPGSDEAYRRLGIAYLRAGNAREAIAALARAAEINPFYWANHNALGAAYLHTGDYARSVESNRRVVEMEPDNVNGWNDLGAGYLQLGRFTEAADAFNKAIALEPVPEAYTNLGIAHYYAGDFALAVADFAKAVGLSPNNEQFVGNLADGYRLAGDLARANEAYDRAIELAYKELAVNPLSAITRSNLALYHAKQGRHAEAQRFMREARSMDPANVNIVYGQALVDALGGRPSEAMTALGEALGAGYPAVIARADPDFATLKDTAAFKALMRRHGAGT